VRWLVGHPGPHFSVHDVYEGWIEGLRDNGQQVFTFNLGDRLTAHDASLVEAGPDTGDGHKIVRKQYTREQAIQLAAHSILETAMLCWPQIIILVSAFFTPPYLLDVLRGRGMKIVLVHTECPYQDDEQLERAAHADINLINDPVSLSRYQALGVPAAYMPHAYRPAVHYPAPAGTVPDWDLSFVGTGFDSRMRFFNAMDLSGLKVKIAGPWQNPADWADFDHDDCIDNADTAAIYRASRAGINFYRREGEKSWDGHGVAMGPREVEMAACGLFFLRDPRPESDETFPMLPSYGSPEEASELLRWWLGHDGRRREAARQARAVVSDRTFTNHARKLLAMLDN
jgi:spore maturation protein CgeB